MILGLAVAAAVALTGALFLLLDTVDGAAAPEDAFLGVDLLCIVLSLQEKTCWMDLPRSISAISAVARALQFRISGFPRGHARWCGEAAFQKSAIVMALPADD